MAPLSINRNHGMEYRVARYHNKIAGKSLSIRNVSGSQGVRGWNSHNDLIWIAKLLTEKGQRVILYDPAAAGSARAVLGARAAMASSAPAAVKEADVVVIATPWKEFRSLRVEDIPEGGRERTVIDPWRIMSRPAAEASRYVILGKARAAEYNRENKAQSA